MNALAPLLVVAGIVGAISLSKPKRRASKPKPAPDYGVTVDDPTIDEFVPAPSNGNISMSGSQAAPRLGGASVDWWVSEFKGSFGWQYIVTADGKSEMSYLDGLIYHYPSAQDALNDLQRVLG